MVCLREIIFCVSLLADNTSGAVLSSNQPSSVVGCGLIQLLFLQLDVSTSLYPSSNITSILIVIKSNCSSTYAENRRSSKVKMSIYLRNDDIMVRDRSCPQIVPRQNCGSMCGDGDSWVCFRSQWLKYFIYIYFTYLSEYHELSISP